MNNFVEILKNLGRAKNNFVELSKLL